MSASPDGFLGSRLANVLGGKTADALRKGLGLLTVEDLLRHYPRRYATRGELTDLSTLREGEQVTVMAEVTQGHGAADASASRLHPRGRDQ